MKKLRAALYRRVYQPILTPNVDLSVPPEFSVGILDSTAPLVVGTVMEMITGSSWEHAVIRIDYNGEPYVYHSHPKIGVMKKSGVQRHSWADYCSVVLPWWNSNFWTAWRSGVLAQWFTPIREFTEAQKEAARKYADMLVDSDKVRYGMIFNYFFGLPSRMHCSQFVGNVLERLGYGSSAEHREDPGMVYLKVIGAMNSVYR